MSSAMVKRLIMLSAVFLLVILVYLPGLYGEFIFDDGPNLSDIGTWLEGQIGWREIVFGNRSGLLGRPIAMATFLVNASVWGMDPFGFKLGNLLLHLATGLALYFLIFRLASRDPNLGNYAQFTATIITLIWLFHPMFASTVLYSVQRMAILSTFFIILALLAYTHGRERIETGCHRAGHLWILAAVPTLTILAMFSKENGVLVPLLCGVIELTYFPLKRACRRPFPIRFFFTVAIGLPVIGALSVFVFYPEFYLQGYANRPFGPMERLLTESRILFDYIYNLLIPAGPKLTLFRDDYQVSTGLFSPLSTAVALVSWLIIIGSAAAARNRHPGITAGVGIFLIGHSLESGVFPLLLYFEHRNYFPSIGVLLAIATIIAVLAKKVRHHVTRPRIFGMTTSIVFIIVLAVATHGRARIWQSNQLLAQQAVENYPDSRFARLELASILMNKTPAESDSAREHYEYLSKSTRTSTQLIGELGMLAVDCHMHGSIPSTRIDNVLSISPETIEPDVVKSIDTLQRIVEADACENLTATRLADAIVAMIDSSSLPENLRSIWQLRFRAAKLYYSDNAAADALEHAQVAWEQGNADLPIGMMVVGLLLHQGQHEQAAQLLDQIGPRIPITNKRAQAIKEEYQAVVSERLGQD